MTVNVTYALRARDTETGFQQTLEARLLQIEQTEIGASAGVLNVTDTEEVIPVGDISTEGILAMRNLDDSETIEFGPESGAAMVPLGLIPPGEIAHFRVKPGVTVRVAVFGSTHVAKLQYILLED